MSLEKHLIPVSRSLSDIARVNGYTTIATTDDIVNSNNANLLYEILRRCKVAVNNYTFVIGRLLLANDHPRVFQPKTQHFGDMLIARNGLANMFARDTVIPITAFHHAFNGISLHNNPNLEGSELTEIVLDIVRECTEAQTYLELIMPRIRLDVAIDTIKRLREYSTRLTTSATKADKEQSLANALGNSTSTITPLTYLPEEISVEDPSDGTVTRLKLAGLDSLSSAKNGRFTQLAGFLFYYVGVEAVHDDTVRVRVETYALDLQDRALSEAAQIDTNIKALISQLQQLIETLMGNALVAAIDDFYKQLLNKSEERAQSLGFSILPGKKVNPEEELGEPIDIE